MHLIAFCIVVCYKLQFLEICSLALCRRFINISLVQEQAAAPASDGSGGVGDQLPTLACITRSTERRDHEEIIFLSAH